METIGRLFLMTPSLQGIYPRRFLDPQEIGVEGAFVGLNSIDGFGADVQHRVCYCLLQITMSSHRAVVRSRFFWDAFRRWVRAWVGNNVSVYR